MTVDTVIHRLISNAQKMPNDAALVHKVGNEWKPISWKQYADDIERCGRAFMALGLQPGQIVTIISYNRPEWVIADLAAMAVGGVATGIYQTSTADGTAYIISHSEAPICIIENLDQLNKLRGKRSEFPTLKWAILLDGDIPDSDRSWVMSWSDLQKHADKISEAAYRERLANLRPENLATLIYTSGTTGNPKGVMLSHHNLTWTADSLEKATPLAEKNVGVSYLPLSHIAEQMLSLHMAITVGVTVWFAEGLEKVRDCLSVARPTVFFGVPRVWEKFEAVLSGRFKDATGVKASLLAFARRTATEVNEIREKGRPLPMLTSLKYALARKLVLGKLHSALGLDRCKVFVSGAAPISRGTLDFFRSLDIPLMEVYGQSEGSGPTTFNQPERYRIGSVGRPIPGVEVKIASDGEILVRGGNVFMGYYKNPEATAETLSDGWLCSGDVGKIDNEGFLHITDRKKDLIITAGGKNVAPQNIEKLLREIPEVAQAVVIGDRMKYLTALLTLEADATKRWFQTSGAEFHSVEVAVSHGPLRTYLASQVESVNGRLAQYETIKKFEILSVDFSVDTGELTPSLKIKRKVVYGNHAKVIEMLYSE